MAAQISDAADQKQLKVLPPEILLKIIGYVDYNWPDVWGSMRLTSHAWKFEVENLVQKDYLLNMTIRARGNMFRFIHTSNQYAIFKLQGNTDRRDWAQTLESLEHSAADRIITLSDLRTANNAKIAGLQSSYENKIISIEWLPTISALFRVESGLRAITREESRKIFDQYFAGTGLGAPRKLKPVSKETLYIVQQKDKSFLKWLCDVGEDLYRTPTNKLPPYISYMGDSTLVGTRIATRQMQEKSSPLVEVRVGWPAMRW